MWLLSTFRSWYRSNSLNMPSLNSLPLSLSEILETHRGPLRELEIWALLCQCAEAMQDLLIKGNTLRWRNYLNCECNIQHTISHNKNDHVQTPSFSCSSSCCCCPSLSWLPHKYQDSIVQILKVTSLLACLLMAPGHIPHASVVSCSLIYSSVTCNPLLIAMPVKFSGRI